MENAVSASTFTRNVGVVGGQGPQTQDPSLTDVDCDDSFPVFCGTFDRFRTISGVCNNPNLPKLGMANTRFGRFLAPRYADGLGNVPRGGFSSADNHKSTGSEREGSGGGKEGYQGGEECPGDPRALLPNPRRVSFTAHFDKKADDVNVSR